MTSRLAASRPRRRQPCADAPSSSAEINTSLRIKRGVSAGDATFSRASSNGHEIRCGCGPGAIRHCFEISRARRSGHGVAWLYLFHLHRNKLDMTFLFNNRADAERHIDRLL